MHTPGKGSFRVAYTILPGDNIPAGKFLFSLTPPVGNSQSYVCRLSDNSGKEVNNIETKGNTGSSSLVDISSVNGTALTINCNFSDSGIADTQIPVDLQSAGGMAALSGMDIAVTVHEPAEHEQVQSRQLQMRNATDPPANSYLTGFDDTGLFFFLSYIPWINSHLVVAQPPSQNSQYAISGSYSCQFNEGLLGQSYIDTINLAVPSGSTHVMISFAILLMKSVPPGNLMTMDFYENGSKISSSNVSLSGKTPINGWYNQQFNYALSSSAVSTFQVVISLNSTGNLGGVLVMDNLAINFMTDPPAPDDSMMVYSDESGSLYGLDAYTGTRNWTFSGDANFLSSSIFIVNGVAYIADGSSQSTLHAVNVSNGTELWKRALQGSMYCSPVVYGTLLIAACSNGYVYALNMNTGVIAWSADFYDGVKNAARTDTVVDYVNGISSDNHGLLYLSTDTGIFAMNVTSQRSLWHCPTTQPVPFAPCLTEQEVVYGDVTGNIVCLNKSTGVVKWSAVSSAPINSEPYLVGGIVIIGNDGGTIAGYNVGTGAQVWSLNFPGTMIRSFTVDGPYIHFAANAIGGTCYCYSFSVNDSLQWTLQQVWSAPLPLGAQCPPLIAHDLVYYTASNRELYALDKMHGTESWDFNSGSIGFASPAVVAPEPIPSLGRRYDQYCYLVAHNAYANIDDGWTYAQQSHNIVEQLDMGARALELDIYKQTINNVQQVVYDHAGISNWYIFLMANWKLLSDSLSEIKTWLDNNPKEVVTIIFEQPNFQNPDPMITAAFTASGIAGYVYYANQINYGLNGNTWNNATQGWPTLQWMVDNGKRLVVFSQKRPPAGTGFPYLWDYAVENEYGTPSIRSGCEPRSESAPLNQNTGKLFVVNYAVNIPTTYSSIQMPSTYTLTNNYYWLLAKLRSCQDVSSNKALPNLVKVNFFEYGFSGGPLRVIEEINKEWAG